ncbi:MAG: CehA/McbA family metallohydrolase [Planctomycetota bacterium]
MTIEYLTPVDDGGGCTRRHALKVFAACAGGVVLGSRLPRGWADLPWGEHPAAAVLEGRTRPPLLGETLSYGKARRQAHPTLAVELMAGRLWTSWNQFSGKCEAVMLRSFDINARSWSTPVALSAADLPMLAAGESALAVVGSSVLVVWSQFGPYGWSLLARALDTKTGKLSAAQLVAGERKSQEVHLQPAVAVCGERALLVWQAKLGRQAPFVVLGRVLDAGGRPLSETLALAADDKHDHCQPAVAARPDGSGYVVAYDRQDAPGTQNVYVTQLAADKLEPGKAVDVSRHPASDLAPALAFSPAGDYLWVAWHSNRRGEDGWDIPRWYRLAALRMADNTWHQPFECFEEQVRDERGTVQSFELVRLTVSPTGVVCVLGHASHNFYLQYYSTEGRSPVFRFPKDGWGGRGKFIPGVFDENGALWVTRRDLGTNVLDNVTGLDTLSGPPRLEARVEVAQIELAGRTSRIEWPEPAGKPAELKVYFGDIHGHSWQSDGMGEPAELFLRARDVFNDDFHALTDHDNFVGQRLTDAHWQQQKELVEHYHKPGSFVTLFAQEWTTPRVKRPHGWGHFNVYTADPAIPMLDHRDPRWRDLPELYAEVRKYNGIAIPHHIGWTGVPWESLDTDLTPVVEICSVHGAFEYEGNKPIAHRGGMPGCFYRDGLARGLRIGVVGATDQHGLIWHHGVCWKRDVYRAGLTGVWAPELTRGAIMDAMRARRTFATTGVKLQLYFAINEVLMGGAVETAEPPALQVNVAVPVEAGRLRWLQIVRDGQVINTYGGEGQHSRYTFVDEQCPVGVTSSYYLRVTLADNNMAWSSPVWVRRS